MTRALALLLLASACNDSFLEADPVSLAFGLPEILSTMDIPAGQTTSATVPLAVDGAAEYFEIQSLDFDLERTAQDAQVTITGEPIESGAELTGTVYIDAGGSTRACEDGAGQAPGTITLDGSGAPTGTNPGTVELDEDALAHLNTGEAALCAEVDSPTAMSLTLPYFYLSLVIGGQCEDGRPTDMDGAWEGTYTCENVCSGTEGGDITLTVDQSGSYATYTDDGGASYAGYVCGAQFVFVGGAGEPLGSEYRESGILTVDGDTATKVSTWSSGWCGGICQDELTRVR